MFQEHALFPHLTVAQNVAFGLRRLRRDERGSAAPTGSTWSGSVRTPAATPTSSPEVSASGSPSPRAGPAPRLMLLDEPFASLDPNLRSQIRTEVIALLRATGTPAVFVTHDQTEALATGDRVAVMRAGRIAQLGSPTAVYHAPASRFVAGFMGDADFLPVRRDGERAVTELGELAGRRPSSARWPWCARRRLPSRSNQTVRHRSSRSSSAVRAGTTRCDSIRARCCAPRGRRETPVEVGTRVRPLLAAGHRPVLIADEA